MNGTAVTTLLLLGILAGCKGSGTTPSGNGAGADARLESDADLETKLMILDPETVSAGAERTLTLRLENATAEKLTVRCTVDWFDQAGARLTLAPAGWVRVELDARGSEALRFQFMPAEARSWRLRFQRG